MLVIQSSDVQMDTKLYKVFYPFQLLLKHVPIYSTKYEPKDPDMWRKFDKLLVEVVNLKSKF